MNPPLGGPGIFCRFTLAGVVEAFDIPAFRQRLLAMFPAAFDVVHIRASAGSVAVEATLIYATTAEAEVDEAELQQASLADLSQGLGQTVEASDATLVLPTATPTQASASWIPAAAALVGGFSCVALALTMHIMARRRRRQRTADAGKAAVKPVPTVKHTSTRTLQKMASFSSPRRHERYASLADGSLAAHLQSHAPPEKPGLAPELSKAGIGSLVEVSLDLEQRHAPLPPPNVRALERARAGPRLSMGSNQASPVSAKSLEPWLEKGPDRV